MNIVCEAPRIDIKHKSTISIMVSRGKSHKIFDSRMYKNSDKDPSAA